MFANVFCYFCNVFCSCFHAKNNKNNNNKKASFRTFEQSSRSTKNLDLAPACPFSQSRQILDIIILKSKHFFFLCATGGAKGPGIFFIIPCTDSYQKVDLRTVSFDVPPQEVLSRDSVTVSVDAVVYYRVSNPTMATNNIEDYRWVFYFVAYCLLSSRPLDSHPGFGVSGKPLDCNEVGDCWGCLLSLVVRFDFHYLRDTFQLRNIYHIYQKS